MARVMETVLYYNPDKPGTAKNVSNMKAVLVRMGIRIRNVSPEQVNQTVGYLLSVDGYEAAPEETGELPVIEDEMLVMKQFTSSRIDELLVNLRKAGVPKIALKAVMTENNCGWTFYQLYKELREEHEKMTGLETNRETGRETDREQGND